MGQQKQAAIFSVLISHSPPGRARVGSRGAGDPSLVFMYTIQCRSAPPPVRVSREENFWWWRNPARAESGESGCRGAWMLGRACFSGFRFGSGEAVSGRGPPPRRAGVRMAGFWENGPRGEQGRGTFGCHMGVVRAGGRVLPRRIEPRPSPHAPQSTL